MRKQDLIRVSSALLTAYQSSCDVPDAPAPVLGVCMEQALRDAEHAVLTMRCVYETHYPAPPESAPPLLLDTATATGRVAVSTDGWVQIRLRTLLTHCRASPTGYLERTILSLLTAYRRRHGALPWFEQALVVIHERSPRPHCRVFDPDNKDWKAVTNALKNILFADDDQFTVGLVLLATPDDTPGCEITVLPPAHAARFFGQTDGWHPP